MANDSASRPARGSRNWNVVLGISLAAAAGLSESVWGSTVLSAFIYILTDGSNLSVGYAEGVQGVSALLTALPVGWLADKWPRSKIIAIGGLADILAIIITGYVVICVGPLWLLMVGLVLWGVVNTTTYGPSQALYADSVPTGERSRYYNYLFLAWLLPSAIGPAISVLMFTYLGDNWTISDLRPIFLLGLALEIPVAVLLFMFDDKKALGSESDHIGDERDTQAGDETNEAPDSATVHSPACFGGLTTAMVPYILFTADLIGSLGSGMTVKFFPLFFKNDIGMSPKAVQGVYIAVPVAIAAAATLCTWLAKHIGRVQTIIVSKIIGTSMLFLIVSLKSSASASMMVGLYLVRAAFQNATYPLSESILMDFVAKEFRARWKSLESVVQFGWCGSAVVGGWLGDRYGYSSTFFVTACLQASGAMLYLLLLKLVPVKEGRAAGTPAGDAEEDPYAPLPAFSAEREPLLSPPSLSPPTMTPSSESSPTAITETPNDGDEVNIAVSPQSAERYFHQQWNDPSR